MTASRIHRLRLTHFRNYRAAALERAGDWSCWSGPNGAGKTNLPRGDLVPVARPRPAPRHARRRRRHQGDGSWAVVRRGRGRARAGHARHRHRRAGSRRRGRSAGAAGSTASRSARPTAFGDHLRMVWLTPSMDGCSSARPRNGGASSIGWCWRSTATIPAASRRSIAACARATACSKSATRRPLARRHRARDRGARRRGRRDARRDRDAARRDAARARRRARRFLGAASRSTAGWKTRWSAEPATAVEDRYREILRASRARDAAAGRTLDGPHLTDLRGDLRAEEHAGARCLDRRAEGAADRPRAGACAVSWREMTGITPLSAARRGRRASRSRPPRGAVRRARDARRPGLDDRRRPACLRRDRQRARDFRRRAGARTPAR